MEQTLYREDMDQGDTAGHRHEDKDHLYPSQLPQKPLSPAASHMAPRMSEESDTDQMEDPFSSHKSTDSISLLTTSAAQIGNPDTSNYRLDSSQPTDQQKSVLEPTS